MKLAPIPNSDPLYFLASVPRALLLAASICTLATGPTFGQTTQHPAKVGILWIQDSEQAAPSLGAFKEGLRELKWIEGRNVVFVERYDRGDESQFPKLAAELVALNVDVIYANDSAVPAARQATKTIPIVCPDFYDPVAQKITASMGRPEGNITGVSWQSVDSAIKRLQLTRELVPSSRRIGLLYNAAFAGAVMEARGVFEAARKTGISVVGVEFRTADDLPEALGKIKKERFDALLVSVDALAFDARNDIGKLASSLRIPMIAEISEFAEAGAILTYGADTQQTYRRSAYFEVTSS